MKAGYWILAVVASVSLGFLSGCGQGPTPAGEMDTAAAARPIIEFTSVPPLNSTANLVGRVYNVDPADYAVAVYIRVAGGWWNKPYDSQMQTPILANLTWTCDITTGGQDPTAERLAAFIIPQSYTPPESHGPATLPDGLRQNAVASVETERQATGNFRVLRFSGREWAVKSSGSEAWGPGPNYFSASAQNVWVDGAGRLHLRIARQAARWNCAEVILRENLGRGRYVWTLDSRVDNLDPNVTLGLFTWDDDPADNHREIDIELARWGNAADPTGGQYVVQPWDTAGNLLRWIQPPANRTTHSFRWQADRILFKSVVGTVLKPANPGQVIRTWTYRGPDVPSPGQENARMNLWLMGGNPPTNGRGVEVIIRSFTFLAN